MGIGLSSSGKIVLLAARLAATFAHFPFFRSGVILSFERVATIFRRANNASGSTRGCEINEIAVARGLRHRAESTRINTKGCIVQLSLAPVSSTKQFSL